MTPDVLESIEKAVQKAFSVEGGDRRFIDITRIPLLCQNMVAIHQTQTEMKDSIKAIDEKLDRKFVSKDQFAPVQKIVYGGVALILTAVVLAFLAMIIATK